MEPEVVVDSATGLGIDKGEHVAALKDGDFRVRLSSEVDAAFKIGVFDANFFTLGEKQFWDRDRLDQLDKSLETGAGKLF